MFTTNINIRVDKKTKEKAEYIFSNLGLNMSTAINIFLRTSIRENGIPFPLKLDIPNTTTIAAIEEGNKIVLDKNVKSYNNISDLRKDLDI
ncbi:type II toxin-antitoxin system RelB/DinJ family antitoxin [Streptobacillus canis]|uniref:type II toxin-antitoxin system RelB/DinJ family antitoxin n=1 Tax=Streptobacillus canis TaxID=2678686 RepID=UPI0012E1A2B7|nr:type II toxin-antitoxin system RelB/DinJ family antitoxin [Streptobacillus canis]